MINKPNKTGTFLITIWLCITMCAVPSLASQKTIWIEVAAGKLDRADSVSSFQMPKEATGKAFVLRDEQGKLIPVQVDESGRAIFILPKLRANTTKRFRLVATKEQAKSPGVQLVRERDKLFVTSAGRKIFTYQAEPGDLPNATIKPVFKRGGYIHPVYTPAGRIITDDFPSDHFHHHGIWFAWTKTEFEGRHPDFWNVGDGTGRIDFVALDRMWSGAVHAGFKARTNYIDVSASQPRTVLNDEWVVTVYRVGLGQKAYSMFDLVSTHELMTSSPLLLPEYRYGGLGFRGAREWLAKDNCVFLTSEGKDRSNGHATRARWCHIGGKVGGELAGIAIFDNPNNFRAPQAMRINPDQPFFCYSPSLSGDWKISPGEKYVSRYRFVVYDGAPDSDQLNRLWEDYANPPQVTVSVK
ncbi:MAG: PmoA family protein [Acidobacteriota bacterium]